MDLHHFVNEALMALFFFVVGLEIKRELVSGELRTWQRAALPAVAAVGGMVVPAVLYLAANPSGPGSRGWGVPMATDIAFAVGVVALLGPRVPANLKIFLLTLAIVDDIGAILVIALAYSTDVNVLGLLAAAGVLLAMGALRFLRIDWMPAFVVLGFLVWLAVYESGVHATIAGVVLGLLAPARPLAPAEMAREWAADLRDEPTVAELHAMTTMANASVSVAERLQHSMHPFTSFLIIPVFALANAGVTLDGDALSAPGAWRVFVGVVFGLVVGKLVGISAFSWGAMRLGVGELPEGITPRQLAGAAAVAGIGFTVSLFVAGLAYPAPALEAAAKVGILLASAVASLVGFLILRTGRV
jgi:NhaA family Na+:H+ antiporter